VSPVEIRDGWIITPYAGRDLSRVHISIGNEPVVWLPAFLDWVDGQRVAKVRARAVPEGRSKVWLRVNGDITQVGAVTRRQ
jgi:hypothetical protein